MRQETEKINYVIGNHSLTKTSRRKLSAFDTQKKKMHQEKFLIYH